MRSAWRAVAWERTRVSEGAWYLQKSAHGTYAALVVTHPGMHVIRGRT